MKYSCIFAIMPLIEVNVDKNRLKLETIACCYVAS